MAAELSASDGGHNADFVAFLHGGILIVEKANVLVVQKDVDEAADVSLFITDALSEAGIRFVQTGENLRNRRAFGRNDFFFSSEFTEGCGDTDGCRHWMLVGDIGNRGLDAVDFTSDEGLEFSEAGFNQPRFPAFSLHRFLSFQTMPGDTEHDAFVAWNLAAFD